MKHILMPLFCILLLLGCTPKTEQEPKNELEVNSTKTLIDFFLSLEQQGPLVSEGIWGDDAVIPRDIKNGLEGKSEVDEKTGEVLLKDWCYWDGSILKDDDGKYHMYACRWSQEFHHGTGWTVDSKGVHAVSDSLWGPYEDLGLLWPEWKGGKGANVIGLKMHDGRYALVTSEIVPGQVFVSNNPNGPFELLGDFIIDPNGYYPGWGRYNELDTGALKGGTVGNLANVMIIQRPGGGYMMVARHCVPMVSEDNILGPYKMMGDKAWLGVEGIPQYNMEDPTVWYSDGLYHIVVNFHGADTSYHLTSEDGYHNWKNRGLAFHRDRHVFRHKDGTVEDWYTVQRPTVYMQDSIVKAFNFSVLDVHKGQDIGDDENGSKIIVIPFDGEGFNKHIRKIVDEETERIDATPPPSPWLSKNIGKTSPSGNTGYDSQVNTIRVKAVGNKIDGKEDAFRFVYQEMTGDVSSKVFLLTDELSEGAIQSGLMVRKSLEANAPFVFASFTKNKGFAFKQRTESGSKVSIIEEHNLTTPYWVRIEKRDNKITCFVSPSNRKNWDKVGEVEMDFGESFYVGMASTSNGDEMASLARFKDIDTHRYGEPKTNGIVSHTFPDVIPSSGIVEFEVEYESRTPADIWVELENVQTGEKYKVLRERFWKSGTKKLTYNSGIPLNPNNTYWFAIKAVQKHFHDSEHFDSAFKKVSVE